MSRSQATNAKRNREMKLKDKARQKQERRDQRPVGSGGPQIDWAQPGGVELHKDELAAEEASKKAAEESAGSAPSPMSPSQTSAPRPPTPGSQRPPSTSAGAAAAAAARTPGPPKR